MSFKIRPVDQAGDLLGPDYASDIQFMFDGKPLRSVADRGDGSCVVCTLINVGADPELEVRVAGESVVRTLLSGVLR